MAPDKIYVNIPGDYWHPGTDKKLDTDTEYIRKDALLEWLEIAVECYCEGKKWAFHDLINKIKSL